ncbi:MAG: IS110 family transposase [Candidatus Rokubacteria bacterium]|nr:IS110 family transposase [Candidatus Rokubacteria bacterium]
MAVLNTETGEVQERRLAHDDQAVEQFYRALPRPVTVGVESTGYAQWFHALMQRQGHTLLVGDAARIRAMVVRKTKTDRRDAAHLVQLLAQDRFPLIWVPDPRVRDVRALVAHRMRLVRMRTMVKNGLHAIALNARLAAGSALFTRRGRAQLQALALPPHTTERRDQSLELLAWLDLHIHPLDAQIAEAAAADVQARRLMTHPGVGPLTALATVLILGPVARFPTSKHVVSYIGLAPAVAASAEKCRLGHVTKQGNALLRYVLGQAGQVASRSDADLRRLYSAVLHRHGHAKAKVAVARKLLVRLYIMVRDQIDYGEFCERGRPRHLAHPRAEVTVRT